MALTNEALLQRFEAEYLDAHGTTTDRRRVALRELRRFAERLDGRTLLEATPSDMMAWQGAELKRGLAPTTVRMRESILHVFMGWANVAGLMTWELTKQLESIPAVAVPPRIPRPYKRHEIERFREALALRYTLAPTTGPGSWTLRSYFRTRTKYAFERYVGRHARRLQLEAQVSLALEEGLRCSEIYHLTLAQVSPGNQAVVVRCAKTRNGHDRWREVPWTPHSNLCVREWLEFRRALAPGHDCPWLMLRASNQTGAQPHQHFKRSLLTIPGDWKWHRFRHTFATERLRAGMPLEKLQIMMGHSDTRHTLGYAEIVNADVQVEAERTEEAFARNLGLIR